MYKKMKQKWSDLGLEALLIPPYPICAFKNENADDLGTFLENQSMFTILHNPCGVMPIT